MRVDVGDNDVDKSDLNSGDRLVIEHARIHGADFSRRKLMQFCTIGSHFEDCRFNSMIVRATQDGAGHEQSTFTNCSFDQSQLFRGGGFTRFVRCSFSDVLLRDWICFKTEFVDCTFSGRLQRCIFNSMVPAEDRAWVGRERNDYRGNDFSGAELIDVAFRTGIDLSQQRLPTGPDYLYVPDAVAAIERATRGLAHWRPGSESQRLAQVIVAVHAASVADGQQQLLVRISDLIKGRRKFPREVVDKVVSLLIS